MKVMGDDLLRQTFSWIRPVKKQVIFAGSVLSTDWNLSVLTELAGACLKFYIRQLFLSDHPLQWTRFQQPDVSSVSVTDNGTSHCGASARRASGDAFDIKCHPSSVGRATHS